MLGEGGKLYEVALLLIPGNPLNQTEPKSVRSLGKSEKVKDNGGK